MNETRDPSRRRFLITGTLAATAMGVGADVAFAQAAMPPTPACDDGDAATLRQTEGPYYTPRSPERANLREPGLTGTPVILSGLVLTRRCRPVARAMVDLWHADADGVYDNVGFRLRGHVFTDDNGRFAFRTVNPGRYPGRTRHFHVKVQAPGQTVLTTQLYFPGEAGNRRDGLFRRELLLRVADTERGLSARFDFVLDQT